MLQKAGLHNTPVNLTLHSFRLYSVALHKVAELEAETRNEIEEAEAAEQLKGHPQQQVEYCRDQERIIEKKGKGEGA